MKKSCEKPFRPHFSKEVIETLRKRGGAHGSKKGKRGYNRKQEKFKWKKEIKEES